MSRLAVVGGHSILDSGLVADADRVVIDVDGEAVVLLDAGRYFVLQRHGLDDYTPAHGIDHVRHIRALALVGCTRVLALSSVGSLRPELTVGSALAPDDFIALDQLPVRAHGDAHDHVVPAFTPGWRAEVVHAWAGAGGWPLVDGGVYWQANGPRFETPAEIRMIATVADVVGMTVASECVAACQLGVDYAAVCVVDNLANGIGHRSLTVAEFEAGKAANRARVLAALAAVAPVLER